MYLLSYNIRVLRDNLFVELKDQVTGGTATFHRLTIRGVTITAVRESCNTNEY